jgi:hypothetical protein
MIILIFFFKKNNIMIIIFYILPTVYFKNSPVLNEKIGTSKGLLKSKAFLNKIINFK